MLALMAHAPTKVEMIANINLIVHHNAIAADKWDGFKCETASTLGLRSEYRIATFIRHRQWDGLNDG